MTANIPDCSSDHRKPLDGGIGCVLSSFHAVHSTQSYEWMGGTQVPSRTKGRRTAPTASEVGAVVTLPKKADDAPAVEDAAEQAPTFDQDNATDQDQGQDDDQGQSDGQSGQTRALASVAPSGQKILMRIAGVAYTQTQAIIPANASFRRAEQAYAFAETMRESSKWWQGDVINFVRDHHGEKYSQLASETGQPEGSLRNIASMANKFTPERRRANVSWSHHAAVASLPDEIADQLLLEAEGTEGDESVPERDRHGPWNLDQIRAEAREWREENANGTAATDDEDGPVTRSSAPAAPRGILPVDPETYEFTEDAPNGYGCPTCPDLVFSEMIWHCLACGAHNPADAEDCAYCDLEDETETEDTTAPTTAVSGQVITPADQVSGSVVDLLDLAGLRAVAIRSAVAEVKDDPDALNKLMGLHEWLGRLVDSLASAKPKGKPLAPAPKPTGGKRGRPRKTPNQQPVDDEMMPTDGSDDLDGAFE